MNVGDIIKDTTLPGSKFSNAGQFISGLFTIAIYLATFLAFFWLVWGAFQYMVAGGNKERLAQARARIIWAIVGLVLVAISFLVAQFAQQIILPETAPVPGTPLQ